LTDVGRLAMRVEGNWWVAYYAMPETMDKAIELGRIQMGIVRDEDRKQAFMEIMKSAINDLLGDKVDSWDIQPAPEHERSGRA
jgi:hypothetical protein